MGFKEVVFEAIKMIAGVAIGAGATAFLTLNGLPLIVSAVGGKPDMAALQVLALGVGYSMWKAIVPVIEDIFNKAKATAGMKSTNAQGGSLFKRYLAPI
jgi:hypothetical protein